MTTLNLDNIDLGGFGATDVKPEGEGTGFTGDQYSLDSHTSSTMGEALKTDADQYSKNKQLSRDSGMPESAVAGDPAAVETSLKLKNIDFAEMSRRTPNTSLFLTDFNNAVIAQDDISAMQRVEDVLRSIPGGLVTGFGMAIEGTGRTAEAVNRIGGRALFSVTPEALEPYLFQTPETPDILKTLNDFSNLVSPAALTRSAGAGLKISGEDIADVPVDRQNIATDIGGGLGQVGGQIAATLINPSIALGMMFGQGVDQQGERQEESGTEGRDNVSDFALLAGGGITAVTERTGIDALMNRIPPTIKNKMLRQVADISIAGGIEALQEVVEGIAQGLLEQFTTNPDAEIFEGLDREAIAAGGTGAIVRGIINAITPGKVRSVQQSDDNNITQGQIEQTTLDQLNTQIGGMKMQQRDAETLRAFVEKVDDNDTHIFVDALQTSLFLQDKTPEEIAADPALKLMKAGIEEASITGTDVTIPLADFATDLAGSTTFDELRDHMTMSPEAVTPFRVEAAQEQTNNYVQELMAEAEQNVSQYVEAQDIFETVRQQLVDTGQVTPQNASVMAQVVPAWATVYAKTNGISVQEAFAKSGLSIEGPQTGERARLEGELEILKQEPSFKDAPLIFNGVKNEFLEVLPEDAEIDDVMEMVTNGDFDRETTNMLKALNGDNWLGFDNPAQAISAAFGENINDWEPSQRLKRAIGTQVNTAYGKARLRQSSVLPDRFGVIDAVKGRTPIEDIMKSASDLVGTVEGIYNSNDVSVFSEDNQTAINSIENVSIIHSSRPDKMATVWDESGKVYRVINGKVSEVSTELDPNSDLTPSQGITTNILSKLFRDARNADPAEIESQRVRNLRTTETRRRQERLKTIPAMPADFDQALQQLADWSENLEEFKKALNPDMFDISDRNLTRLGRATMSLDPEFENAGDEGEVTIFRALPEGEEIEAGDWVSFNEGYAAGHETNVGEEGGTTVSIEVPADEVYTPGADENEWVYIPKDTWGDITSIDELWQSLTDGSKPDAYPEVEGGQLFAQSEVQDDKNLFVAHNISSEGILAAADLGGLATPSIAVARADISDFSGFGEVTLLADPSLLEDPKARTFDADVYTPRQPRATYKINLTKYDQWRKAVEADTEGLNLSLPYAEALSEQAGADNMLRSDAVKYSWLKAQGKEPKLKNRKVESTVKAGAKFEGREFMLRDDPKFIKLADKHYRNKINDIVEKSAERAERFEDMYFNEDGTVKSSKINDFAQEVVRFRDSGGKDLNLLRQDISAKFRNAKLREQFEQEVTKDFNALVDGKTLFKGFTDSGNKRFTEYNMVNVVREMTQSLQGGEASFYGAPSVRSAHANEMKTIAQVQARRDQIIPESELAELKEDAASVFENAMEDLKPFYKFDADSWGYAEDAGTAIMEGPKGIRETFNVTPEVKKIIDDLTEYLSALPSTYFETKIQRAVDFSEFNTAVVPRGMNKDALQVLKEAGLKIKTYDSKTEGARAEVIAKQKKLLFQNDDKGTRGYYDPANSMIRLTESADLSTFLHEFAHFMYEMELNTDSNTSDSINNWFKRNASAVALEAGTYEPNTTIIPRHVAEFLDNGTTGDARRDMGIRRAVHEQFARGFETYLMEGKAPSVELRNAFRTFARWMTQIYRSVRGQLNVNLDAEMRQVFDRLLATDEQIAAANARDKHAPMFTNADAAGMTEEQFKAYNDQVEKVKDVETETLRDKLIKEITRSTKKQWIDEKSDIIDEQLDILKKEKVYIAAATLKAPKTTDKAAADKIIQIDKDIADLEKQIKKLTKDNDTVGQFIAKAGGLNRESMEAEGVDPAHFKDKNKVFGKPMFPAKGGMTADDLAELFNEEGFNDGELTANEALEVVFDILSDDTTFIVGEVDVEIANIEDQITNLNFEKEDTESVIASSNIKLDHATVKDMVGFERTDTLKRKSTVIPPALVGMTAKGQEGVHPDMAAAMLGYSSGSEMINDLMNATPINQLASDNAEAIMLERHGDIMNDGTIEKEADDAVHNEERGKLILAELKALRRGTNTPSLDRAQIKAFAEDTIGNLTYKTIFPAKYRKAEIAAAQESAAALATGDKQAAATAKARQVLNYYLGNAATEARAKTDKIVDNMSRYNKKKVREEIQKAAGGYWEQIVKILNRFEFRKTATLKSVDERNVPITEWMNERLEANGDQLVITNPVLNETYQTHWKNIPYDILQGVNDSVKNIEHVARYGNKMSLLGEKVAFETVIADWNNHMNNQPDVFKPQRTTTTEKKNWLRAGMAQMTKIPFMASWLDGGERVGMSHELLMDGLNKAGKEEQVLWKQTGEKVTDAILARSKEDVKRHMSKIFIPEIKTEDHDGNLMGSQIVSVALNTGNAGNLRKMLLGEGWADPDVDTDISLDNPQLQAVLTHMTKSDWEMVQHIWDQMEALYKPLAEVHRRTTGLVPPQVEAVSFTNKHGTFRGGYYPVVYDHHRSGAAAINKDRADAQTDSMFGGMMSIQAAVTAGSTNERTGYYGPINLNLDVVPNHFQETIHFITHHDAVRQLNRLITDQRIRKTITAKLGPDEYAQLKPWLNDMAKEGAAAPPKTFIDAAFGRLRSGVTLGVMGFKASTGIIQISGVFNTYAEVGTKHMNKALSTVYGRGVSSIKDATEFAFAHSNIMETRTKTMDREIKNVLSTLSDSKGLRVVQEASMKHIALIQFYTADLLSWHAAYTSKLEETGDLDKAYKYADWVVENVQGSGATKDMAALMRNQSKVHTTFTMFMTFFSALWNLERDLGRGAKSGLYSPSSVAAKSMFLFTLPVLFEMMMRGELGGEDEEPEEQAQAILTKLALFPIASVPFVRDIASGIGSDYGYNSSPVASMLGQGIQGIKGILNGAADGELGTYGQIKATTKLAGAAAKIPGIGQAFATGEHIYEVIEDGEEFTMHQLLFGPKKD
tara:strand:+ start:23923 stop:32688 length:8766 start_codon:yes stop_codon:yes gene_type:complete